MSKKTRKKNEAEDCNGKKRVVMSGGTRGGFKIFIMLPLSVLRPTSAHLRQPAKNESTTGQKSQGLVDLFSL